MSEDRNAIHEQVRAYYDGRLADHGATPHGADWNSRESQVTRFDVLWRGGPPSASVLDVGCGYGALFDRLSESGWNGTYLGYDLSTAMIDAARRRTGQAHLFTSERPGPGAADRVVASGLFNVRGDVEVAEWERYVDDTLMEMFEMCRHSLSFNVLTSLSDPDRQRSDLYYASPARFVDFCTSRMSRWFTLEHDYGLFEFTITIRRQT